MKEREFRSAALTTQEARDHLRTYGLAVVPIKPSPEMLITAIKIGGVSTEVAWNIYNTMVEAYRTQADYAAVIERHFAQRQNGSEQPPAPRAAGGVRARSA